MAIRSEQESVFLIGFSSNWPLLGAAMLTLMLQLAVVYLEPLQAIFKTTGLTRTELLVCLVLPLIVLVAVECEKWLVRWGMIYRLRAGS